MPRVLWLVLAAAFAAAALPSLATAGGCAPTPRPPDHTLTSAGGHFTINYYTDVESNGDTKCVDYSTATQAGDIAAYAERAYASFTAWGYPAPATPISITLTDLSGPPNLEGYAAVSGITLATPDQIDSFFAGATGLTPAQEEQKAVANALFLAFERATWAPVNNADYWLIDGAAQWAAFQSLGYPAGSALTGLGPADIALDCRDGLSAPVPPVLPFRMCSPDRWTEQGYTRWAFFQLLANKYGTSFVHGVLVNGAAGQSAATALANAIAAKGNSIASVFIDYVNDLMSGNFGVAQLASVRPVPHDAVVVGTIATATPVTVAKVPVNHLAVRYVAFQRGDGDGSHACYAATLSISVAMPAGISAAPSFFWDVAGSAPQPLTISGNTASITVPWDTCDWASARGWLSLPNASTTVDGADFTVTMKQTVDLTTPTTAAAAPNLTPTWGTTIPVPTTDVAPSIEVFGPELLTLSAYAPTIRLIVDSSGPGTVTATLGGTTLGTSTLRAGNNDLRFKVPKHMLTSLRRAAANANMLTLTPMSPSGASVGQAVTRQVAIAAVHKAKAKKHTKK